MMISSRRNYYASLLILFPLASAQTCYFTDGSIAEDLIPCNSTATATTCCRGNAACLTLGLCYMDDDVSINAGACTDRTWKDTNCFQGCDISPNNGSNTLYRCNNNDWCCSPDGTESCCNSSSTTHLFSLIGTGQNYQIYNGSAWASGFTIVPMSALANPTVAVTSTATATLKATATLIINETVHGDAHKATKISVGVGFGVGIPLLATLTGVSVLLVKEKRKTKLLQASRAGGSSKGNNYRNGNVGPGFGPQRQEMSAVSAAGELPGSLNHAELR